jgi:peptide/nickel transport system permease protein
MATLAQERSPTRVQQSAGGQATHVVAIVRYLRRNPELVVGLSLIVFLLTFVVAGHLFVDLDKAKPFWARPLLPPSAASPLGTDKLGRDLLAVLIVGTPQTIEIALMAGLIGVSTGTALGLFSAFSGGRCDAIIGVIVDVCLTIPGLVVLVTLAALTKGKLSLPQMALVVASLAWVHPARLIRAQALSIRERPYLDLARLNGVPRLAIIVKEVLPNLLPYIAAALVGAVTAAVLATVGLEVLGLGALDSVTLGMTLYWVIYYAAIINSWWWWWVPPIVIIIILFTGLFMIAVGLDEISNPRLRRRV